MIRRSPRPLLVVLAALLAASGAVAQTARVAVLPVVIHSMEESGYVRAGISEMLTTRLSQQAGVSALRVDDMAAATVDLEAARAAGRAAGADWVLFGSFTRFGEGASLDLRCVPVASDQAVSGRSVFVHAGTLADLIPRLDSVVQRIGAHVRGGVANASTPVAATAPQDDLHGEVEALKARVAALEAKSGAPAPAPAAAGAAN